MEAEAGGSEPGRALRGLRALRDDYRSWCLRPGAEAGPCRDPRLLGAAARYLRGEPEPGAAFSLLRFPEAVSENREAMRSDCRRHLVRFVRAAELLETLSTNLLLRGWRPEVRSIRTYTGAFVYSLLPVLSASTLQSVLASIGYLPHLDGPHREFRLSQDADADRAVLLGFELLLARLEVQNLLELQDREQLGAQELLEVLHNRFQPAKLEEVLEAKTATDQKEDEDEEQKKEKLESREVPSSNPRPKPRRTRLANADQSLMEMQKTYPDLAFRGRKLVPDRPHKAHSSTRSSRSGRKTSAAAPADGGAGGGGAGGAGGGAGGAGGGAGGGGGGAGGAGGAAAATEELSGPQAISLHITLRAGLTEQSVKPEDLQPTSEPERQKKLSSLSSVEEEQELRCLAERMGQLHVSGAAEESTRRRSPPPLPRRGEAEEEQEEEEEKSFVVL